MSENESGNEQLDGDGEVKKIKPVSNEEETTATESDLDLAVSSEKCENSPEIGEQQKPNCNALAELSVVEEIFNSSCDKISSNPPSPSEEALLTLQAGETVSIGSNNELDSSEFLLSHSPLAGDSPLRQLKESASVGSLLRSPEANLVPSIGCEMCANYEIRLQQSQETERSLKQQLASARHMSTLYSNELSGERLFRSELESKMSKLSSDADEELNIVSSALENLEKQTEDVEKMYKTKLAGVKREFQTISKSRECVSSQMQKLRTEYDRLLGKHRQESQTMQMEAIEFPQSTEELQILCLQLREELIETRAAKEHLEDSLNSEILFLKEQLEGEQQAKDQLEENLMEEVNSLRTELGIAQSQVSELQERNKRADDLERQIAEYQTTVGDLETKLTSLQTERGELDFKVTEYRKKSLALQQELDNCEAVQRDFVKLSQSLQIELEKIRQAEQEVRWQEEEDVYVCNGCKQPFTKSRVRHHCRHCGKIFCDGCLVKSVPSGPQRRPARVCDVCHTLLVRDTAPYFSEQVPNNTG